MIIFCVQHGDWAIETDVYGHRQIENAKPSITEIDDRTIRTKTFATVSAAFDYAQNYLARRKDDPWLAYLEIERREIKMIRKLK
jgi:hypothetical protein